MKSFLVLLIALLTVPIYGQSWGEGPFDLYPARTGTYNQQVWGSAITYLDSTDTVYTKLLPIGEIDGIYKIEFSSDSTDAAADSIYLDVIFYDGNRAASARWTPWYNIFGPIKSDTLYQLYIDPADSTWWMPNMSRQYRVYKTDTADDSLEAFLNDFIR